jgi:uncharacterized protein (TIGR00299 family) protein
VSAPRVAGALHIHLDPLGGIAGDMFLAAVLDAFPQLEAAAVSAMRAAGLPQDWRCEVKPHRDHALAGRRLVIEPGSGAATAPQGDFARLRERLLEAPLRSQIRDRAVAILTRLATAEAAVHGVALDEVHFHELGDWDSIADVVGAAAVIEALGARSWSVAALPTGGGRIGSRHGPLPVPAPATARLLEGFAVFDDGIAGERVTPTGAAILQELAPGPRLPEGRWRLRGTGHGFGMRRLAPLSNVLRLVAYEEDAAGSRWDRIAVITFEVDDQTPEDLAVGLDRLRRQEGVLEVIQAPVVLKKGRLATQVQILALPDQLDHLTERCFIETTTIGLRWRTEVRPSLAREEVAVGAEGVHVKVVARPGGRRTAKAEIDQVKDTEGHLDRTRMRRRAEDRALHEGADDERD